MRTIIYVLMINLLCSLSLATANIAEEQSVLLELSRIANLEAADYITARDKFIESRTMPINMDQAIEKGWKEGLLAFIINARLAKPDWFNSWDNTGFIVTRSGQPGWSPSPYPKNEEQIQYFNVLKMEILWKFKIDPTDYHDKHGGFSEIDFIGINERPKKGIWPKQIINRFMPGIIQEGNAPKSPLDDFNTSLISTNIKLWREIASTSDNRIFKIIACYALTRDDSEINKELIQSKLKSDSVPKKEKFALLCGLSLYEPNYADEVIIETYSNWKNNITDVNDVDYNVARDAFSTLAKRPIDSDSYRFLREVMLDVNESVEIKNVAVSSINILKSPDFIADKDPNEVISFLEDIVTNTSNDRIKYRASRVLSDYHKALIREKERLNKIE